MRTLLSMASDGEGAHCPPYLVMDNVRNAHLT
ncbi:hypothetical protein E5S67_02637 [Microcoleus sp. IPMA8]|uniref:Transposase n=1 Tax=Microcoleus asticus IPMA8 TaxID=2563858 RepID=A0ABX2CYA8_9CYAN|nr:hypothetical protein [Microcoleus asticus IPMA8]